MDIKFFLKTGVLTTVIFCHIFSAKAQTLQKTEKIGTESNLYQPAYNPTDGAVYVSAAKDRDRKGVVYKLDAETLRITDSFPVPVSAPMGLGINVTTQTLYTTNSRTALVTAIDLSTRAQTHISCGVPVRQAREVIVDEKRNIIYVTNVRAGGIWVIDGRTNTFERFIYNLGGAITGAALDVANNKLYATAMRDNQIVVVDAESGIVEKKFDAHGERPTNVFLDTVHHRLFVANQTTENITVLDSENGDLIKAIPTGRGALGVNYDGKRDRIYVANRHGRSISIIDGTSLEVIKTFEIEGLPNTAVIDHATGDVYVTNKDAVPEKDEQGNSVIREAKYGDSVSKISNP